MGTTVVLLKQHERLTFLTHPSLHLLLSCPKQRKPKCWYLFLNIDFERNLKAPSEAKWRQSSVARVIALLLTTATCWQSCRYLPYSRIA